MRKIIAIVLLAIIALTGLGACALSEYVTPAQKASEAAKVYIAKAGVSDPNSYRGYANLEKAIRLEWELKSAYKVYTLGLEQAVERHELDYGILAKASAANTKKGKATEQALFGEKGLISMVLPLAGCSGAAGLLGLMRKRPQDISPQELDTALTDASIDAKDKERQMFEIVNGVKAFLDPKDKTDIASQQLRAALETATNGDTKKVIAAMKA